jgi:uncharacterized membrane protein YciS (DUF1049 family)
MQERQKLSSLNPQNRLIDANSILSNSKYVLVSLIAWLAFGFAITLIAYPFFAILTIRNRAFSRE